MKNVYSLLLSFLLILATTNPGQSEDASTAMKRIGEEVAQLSLGFENYILGQILTEEQKAFAKKHNVLKTLKGTYKFQDGDTFVVVKANDDMIIGIYKQYDSASRETVKQVIGDLMLRFKEPTAMAHEKLIYWAYDTHGKVSQERHNLSKQEGETAIIATVKLQSSASILPDPDPQTENADKVKDKIDKEMIDLYVIITSNPLSKIFLAQK